MGLAYGSRFVLDKLAFAYDMASRKSYLGPPVSNITTPVTASTSGDAASGQEYIGGEEWVNIPELGKVKSTYCNLYNHYTSYTPNSGSCCPAPIQYGFNHTVLPSTLYTYMILYRVESGYTNPNYMYRYEYNSGTYVTEGGVHTTAKRISLGNGWWYAWNTFTTNASTNNISPRLFYYRYSDAFDKVSVAKACIVQGDYSGMHPKYWPDASTGRSTSEVLLDITGNKTITASSLTYSNSSLPTFNGSTNYLQFSSPLEGYRYNWSIEFVAKQNVISSGQVILCPSNAGIDQSIRFDGSGAPYAGFVRIADNDGTTATASSGAVAGEYIHVVVQRTPSLILVYVNGELSTQTNRYESTAEWAGTWRVGQRGNSTGYFNGEIPLMRVYTKILSADEVKINFNSVRGRYNI